MGKMIDDFQVRIDEIVAKAEKKLEKMRHKKTKATVKLSSYYMNELTVAVTEADFDAWAKYFADHINEKTGLDCACLQVKVEQFPFGEEFEDEISCDDLQGYHIIAEILPWLFKDFCDDASAWPDAAK